jgi:hypothetical protein
MARTLSKVPFPETEAQLVALLEAKFGKLTGAPLPAVNDISESDSIYVERYARGGMSSGHISMQFWRSTALPLLRSRYFKISQPSQSDFASNDRGPRRDLQVAISTRQSNFATQLLKCVAVD